MCSESTGNLNEAVSNLSQYQNHPERANGELQRVSNCLDQIETNIELGNPNEMISARYAESIAMAKKNLASLQVDAKSNPSAFLQYRNLIQRAETIEKTVLERSPTPQQNSFKAD